MSEFDWSGEKEAVVFKSVQAIAIYTNPDGDVVLRQERDAYEDNDTFVIVPALYLDDVIAKLERIRADFYQGHEFPGQTDRSDQG